MSSSQDNRQRFIDSLIQFMQTYGFDGVDLDWKYPGADDRGGTSDNLADYVALVSQIKGAFGPKYGVTVTLPTSYWYLQHLNLAELQQHVDWFNVMAYDLHGVWDKDSKNLGPFVAPHTNLTEIDLALDLLWRSGVKPENVVLGQGWYGRSFTLADPSCNVPNGACKFSGPANAGSCSAAPGILDLQEINDIIQNNNLKPVHDQIAGVKWITWGGNQWISYDDADTFKQKKDLANERCLGGLMVWAIDQVDQSNSPTSGTAPNVTPGQQSNAKQMSDDQQVGISCYTTDCKARCKAGTAAVTHIKGQPGQLSTSSQCSKDEYRTLCCDARTTTGKCQWRGFRGAGLACTGGCADGETELVKDTNNHDAKKGDQTCNGGTQSYCCAGYKPAALKTLAKDSISKGNLKDAAKSAAESAGQQAALDIAAKAFCRVAVPALLIPPELLKDLIQIVGEIADAIEIAATPAIIDACVKGIEKEGKAEFKVFGKKHTISMGSPTAVPTREIPPRRTDNPPRTSDKPKSCNAKPKRKLDLRTLPATLPRKTRYDDDKPMEILVRTAKKGNTLWRNGDGYALLETYPAKNFFDPFPDHWQLIVGFVTIIPSVEDELDCKKNFIGRIDVQTRKYIARPFNLARSITPGEVGACMLISQAPAEVSTWWQSRPNSRYSDKGPIDSSKWNNDNLLAFVQDKARVIGQYNKYKRDCYQFTNTLYKDLK